MGKSESLCSATYSAVVGVVCLVEDSGLVLDGLLDPVTVVLQVVELDQAGGEHGESCASTCKQEQTIGTCIQVC
jgi:hypothetical protein